SCACHGEDHRLSVEVGRNRTLRLLSEATGFEADSAGAEAAVVENGLGGSDFRTFQEVSPSLFRLVRPCDDRDHTYPCARAHANCAQQSTLTISARPVKPRSAAPGTGLRCHRVARMTSAGRVLSVRRPAMGASPAFDLAYVRS